MDAWGIGKYQGGWDWIISNLRPKFSKHFLRLGLLILLISIIKERENKLMAQWKQSHSLYRLIISINYRENIPKLGYHEGMDSY